MRDTHIYVKKSHRQRNTNDQFVRKVWSPWNYSRLYLLNFQGLCIRKYYKRAPQLATKESEGASTKSLIVIYKLNNARSQKLPTVLMKKEVE